MNNLIIFDKDGTLIKPLSEGPWVDHPEDQTLIEGVKERLEELRDAGWAMAIASNQGGVAAGRKSLDAAADEMTYAMRLLGIPWGMMAPTYEEIEGEALFLAATVSSDWREALASDSFRFRKPAPGMLLYLRDQLLMPSHGEWDRLVFVGDRPEDHDAAEAAGFEFCWADSWLERGVA